MGAQSLPDGVLMSSLRSDITVPGRPEVSAGIYAYIQPDGTWWINNTGVLVGPQGAISIDTCATQRRTRAYLDAIAAVTPAPVRAVINAHHHADEQDAQDPRTRAGRSVLDTEQTPEH
jgi:cyclase